MIRITLIVSLLAAWATAHDEYPPQTTGVMEFPDFENYTILPGEDEKVVDNYPIVWDCSNHFKVIETRIPRAIYNVESFSTAKHDEVNTASPDPRFAFRVCNNYWNCFGACQISLRSDCKQVEEFEENWKRDQALGQDYCPVYHIIWIP